MNAHSTPTLDAVALRRRVANELFQRLAFTSFAIWTGGCFLLFITFATGNERPIFPAMMSMMTPLVPAFLVWLLYRPLVERQVARRLREASA